MNQVTKEPHKKKGFQQTGGLYMYLTFMIEKIKYINR
jgi:hypothetical protein